MSRPRLIFVSVLLLFALTLACTSRYRLDLNMTLGEQTRSLDIETTRYLEQAELGNPLAEQKVMRGEKTVILVRGSTRGMRLESAQEIPTGLSFDEYLKTDIYVELPAEPTVAVLPLAGRSIVHVLERYYQPLEEKVFLAVGAGEITVDSITDDYLFASLRGRYENRSRQVLVLSGSFRARRPE